MSLIGNENKVAAIEGMIAATIVCLTASDVMRSKIEFGDEAWWNVLELAIDLRIEAAEEIKALRIGKHSVHVQREGDEIIALVLPTDHPQRKSLHRTIRRLAKPCKPSTATINAEPVS